MAAHRNVVDLGLPEYASISYNMTSPPPSYAETMTSHAASGLLPDLPPSYVRVLTVTKNTNAIHA